MDGNRRFAERLALPTMEGHSFGYSKLLEAFEWCLELGVQCVSVYAFSVDNFKRSALEVEALMDLACAKFALMMDQQSSLRSQGVRVCVLGRLDLLPANVREAAKRVVDATKDYTGPRLNICFAYSSAVEMLAGTEARTAGLEEKEADDFGDYLYTKVRGRRVA
ncbi:putative undecaprenyl diphosphate synthase [Helicosporidium sp. ATCC 50920]|nr:putative undecaprenyl diphosphate synthase [Helicosporidium sp. ATCC 50920]|eukprot:KDD76662.1 putative undecaprenyl diphosphate synthase [Helicosporidium sp. ATCC 50920]